MGTAPNSVDLKDEEAECDKNSEHSERQQQRRKVSGSACATDAPRSAYSAQAPFPCQLPIVRPMTRHSDTAEHHRDADPSLADVQDLQGRRTVEGTAIAKCDHPASNARLLIVR